MHKTFTLKNYNESGKRPAYRLPCMPNEWVNELFEVGETLRMRKDGDQVIIEKNPKPKSELFKK